MKLTEKENLLLRRALDPASSPNEAEMAMAAFARLLRKRGVSGYDFVPPNRQAQPQGPQARPSDSPPEPPKSSPPPPQPPPEQKAYEQATEPEPTRWTPPPPERESRFGRWIGSWLYRIGFFFVLAFIGHQCSQHHSGGSQLASGEHLATPTPPSPVGSIQNPYRFINWKDWTDYNNLPMFSYYLDPQNKIRRKMPPPSGSNIAPDSEIPRDSLPTPAPTPYSDPRGSRTNPYSIDWQKSSCFKLWEAVPDGSYYINSRGQLTKKLSNPSGTGSRTDPR
jgi:hypothetical protein